MSYSFAVQGKTKAEAIAAVNAAIDGVADAQPSHKTDADAAKAAAKAFIEVCVDPAEDENVIVNIHGALSWREADKYTGASVGVSVRIGK